MTNIGIKHLIAILVYMAFVVGIGAYFARKANKNPESFFLGGRSLGPWVTAFSDRRREL